MTAAGTLTTLTLPTGVTVDSTRRIRGATLNNLTVIVNSPSMNLSVDRFNTVRPLCPRPPSGAMTLANAAGGTLVGAYFARSTFKIKDDTGNLVAETPFSPSSNTLTTATHQIAATVVPVSSETITSRQTYRTTAGGSTMFPWLEIEGNTTTSFTDGLTDAGLQLVAAPTDLGFPPRLEMVVEWRNRLWGKAVDDINTLRFSGNGRIFAWAASQSIPIPPPNRDATGITGLIARRDELGVGTRNAIHKITGTEPSNFTRYSVKEGIGVWATDSIAVIHDVAYFLGNPFGVYTWSNAGIKSITDDKVKSWFATNTYFNQSELDNAVGFYDPVFHMYVLFLPATGVTALNRFITYDIASGTWWGPHLTGAFTTNGGATLLDANDVGRIGIFGTDGRIYIIQATYTDGASTAIDMDVTTSFLSMNSPDIQKRFGQLAVISGVEAGGTLTITPSVGGLDAAEGTAISHDLTLGRESLRRLGTGRNVRLRFRINTNTRGARIYGVEIPFFELGSR